MSVRKNNRYCSLDKALIFIPRIIWKNKYLV